MKILLDMNISPDWVDFFKNHKINAVHWSEVGKLDAPDNEIMDYAINNNFIVFTHDLDFGDLLAIKGYESPSVIQVRINDITPESTGSLVISSIRQFEAKLKEGALITLHPKRFRARILPLKRE